VVALDQITKALVRTSFSPGEFAPFIDGVLFLTYVRNTGAAFGLLPGRQPVFIAISLVVLLFVAAYWRRSRPAAWPVVIALGLVSGGAVGNLIDRAFLGKVTDFLAFAFIDFPVFNIADAAIIAGAGILMVWLLFGPEPEALREPAEEDAREGEASASGDAAAEVTVDGASASEDAAEESADGEMHR